MFVQEICLPGDRIPFQITGMTQKKKISEKLKRKIMKNEKLKAKMKRSENEKYSNKMSKHM